MYEGQLCSPKNARLFFPPVETDDACAAAKRICRDCPARRECLEDALADGSRFGVFGGTTGIERDRLRGNRRRRF